MEEVKILFVSYDVAVLCKENGFDRLCFGKFLIPEIPENRFRFNTEGTPKNYNTGLYGRFISAPLYQQVVDWFRESHKIHICNEVGLQEPYKFYSTAWKTGNHYINNAKYFETKGNEYFYINLTTAIIEAFKLISNNTASTTL